MANERRTKPRKRVSASGAFTLWAESPDGAWTQILADVGDRSESGVGILLAKQLETGQNVMLDGAGFQTPSGGRPKGTVCWCRPTVDGRYRAGIALEDLARPAETSGDGWIDHYEVMELNANATPDTVHRVYRMLAQRLHPDNTETGNADLFRRVVEAYRILSDPERRAAFDSERVRKQGLQWKVFDQHSAAPSVEHEQAKRRALLKALYLKRLRDPDHPGVPITEIEAILGTPREHLTFTIWFLKEQGWVKMADNGRYSITCKGVEQAEVSRTWDPDSAAPQRLQLEPAY